MGTTNVHFRESAETVGSPDVPELDVYDLVVDLEGLALEVAGDCGLGLLREGASDEAIDETCLACAYLADDEYF